MFQWIDASKCLCGFMWEIERRSQRVAIRVFALCELIVGMYDSM